MILCISSFIGNEYIFLKWIYIFIGTWTTFLIFCKFRMILFLSLLPVLKVWFYINEVEHAFILTLCCRKGAGRVSWESEGEIPVISIALVIFSFKYRSDYQTMTGHNWNLLVSIEIPQFVIAGLADSSTNSLLSACVWGSGDGKEETWLPVICVLIPFLCESQYLSSNWAPTDLLIRSMSWCLWVLVFKN